MIMAIGYIGQDMLYLPNQIQKQIESTASDSNTAQENPEPLTKLAAKYWNERTDSSSESDIPLM